uniref:class D beta-lactamase OXA-957 n=1 Tax=uncultured bacterium TaxID=77133 RepID=UPI001C3269B0|nr:class D beta-lactamase OXA-957 [uncultured bacterium]QWJ89343.1 class D beta-lactamase OXA-957 [uncultured bacterium]
MKLFFCFALLILISVKAFGQIDLQRPFQDCALEGSITVFDYKNKKWTFSDRSDARRETLPASTFKVINSLIALETGAVEDEKEVFKWDGRRREVDAWNADTDMENAFRNSTVWFYEELAKRAGKEKYREILKKSRYGNGKIDGGEGVNFWVTGEFGVTPENQIKFLKAFYEERLPFSRRSFEIVKRIMLEEKADKYTLRAKTGWTRFGGKDTGWWIGYVERSDNTYFFATRVTKPRETQNPRFGECRKLITRDVLRQMKIIE